MRGINKVILLGTLGKDPDKKKFQDQNSGSTFTIATSERYNTDNGYQEDVQWHRIVATGELADRCNQLLRKGSKVYIEGSLRTRSWLDNKTKETKYITEIRVSYMQVLEDGYIADHQNHQNHTSHRKDYNTSSNNTKTQQHQQDWSRPKPTPQNDYGRSGRHGQDSNFRNNEQYHQQNNYQNANSSQRETNAQQNYERRDHNQNRQNQSRHDNSSSTDNNRSNQGYNQDHEHRNNHGEYGTRNGRYNLNDNYQDNSGPPPYDDMNNYYR